MGKTQKGKKSRYKFVGYVGYHHLWLNILIDTVSTLWIDLQQCKIAAIFRFFLRFWWNNCLKFSHRKHGLNKPLTILVKSDLSFLVNSAAIISKMYLKLFAVSFVYNIPYVWFVVPLLRNIYEDETIFFKVMEPLKEVLKKKTDYTSTWAWCYPYSMDHTPINE